jgi:hypothetical protein
MEWSCGGFNGKMTGPDIKPWGCADISIEIPAGAASKQSVDIVFTDPLGNRVDEYRFEPEGQERKQLSMVSGRCCLGETKLSCSEDDATLSVVGEHFRIIFDKASGLIRQGDSCGRRILMGGPFMNTPYLRLEPWRGTGISLLENGDRVVVKTSGSYGHQMDVTFIISILRDGTVETGYTIDKLYVPLPKQVKLRVGVDCGGLDEIGVGYLADPSLDTLYWKRKGSWTVYPEDHISRCEGVTKRRSSGSEFSKKPGIPWSQEMKSFILNGNYDVDYRGTNDFRSLKEHIYMAALYQDGKPGRIEALSDGSHSVRLEIAEPEEKIVSDRDPRIRYQGTWYAMEDFSGSRDNTEMWSREAGASAELTFE